ncbi:MAG TPA: septum formation initiator family protein, partial [Candidatus Acidoferrum sp.]|nr:septum formation initiator family protein [Candidatus Acidoferrum sp.]
FLVALVAVSVLGNRGLVRLYQMHRDKAVMEREIEQLSAANAALADEVRLLKADPARIEGIAREELGLVKPGELVYEFQAAPRPPAAPEAH